jgi:nitrogen fixation protein NifU and related proteins
MDIYREIILDHYKNPRNFGHLKRPDAKVEEGNVTCGDRIIMEVAVSKDTLEDVRFSGEGCAISQASASMLTEQVKGKTLTEIQNLDAKYILSMLGTILSPTRTKCAILPLQVLQKAILQIVS